MTTYHEDKQKCAVCRKKSIFMVLTSTNSFGPLDLDLRPAGQERHTISVRLQECEYCGYVNTSVAKLKANGHQFAFPKYCSELKCNSNSASAALNKWLKLKIGEEFVIHSFRHSFRDGLRSVNCPVEIIDSLGGWSLKGIGANYGSGYSVAAKFKWMEKMTKSRLLKNQDI